MTPEEAFDRASSARNVGVPKAMVMEELHARRPGRADLIDAVHNAYEDTAMYDIPNFDHLITGSDEYGFLSAEEEDEIDRQKKQAVIDRYMERAAEERAAGNLTLAAELEQFADDVRKGREW